MNGGVPHFTPGSTPGMDPSQMGPGQLSDLNNQDLRSLLKLEQAPEVKTVGEMAPTMDWVDAIDKSFKKKLDGFTQASKSGSVAGLMKVTQEAAVDSIVVGQISKSSSEMRQMITRLLTG